MNVLDNPDIIHRSWRDGSTDVHTVSCTRCGFDADSRIHPDWYHRTLIHQCAPTAPECAPYAPAHAAPDDTPTLGAHVHYRSYGSLGGRYRPECRAAIITAVNHVPEGSDANQPVHLTVFNPDGTFLKSHIEHGTVDEGGTWHWPHQ